MNNSSKKKLLVFIVFFLFSVLFVKVLAPYGLATSPDSLSYMEVARSIQNGDGPVGLDREFKLTLKKETVPVTIWPPLYPTIIALLVPSSPDESNIRYVSALSLSICLLIICLLLKRMTTWIVAIGLSLLYCMTVPILLDYSYVWSETVFITLYTCLLWSIVNYLEHDRADSKKKYLFLFLISLFIVALFYTRYAGVLMSLLLFYVFINSKKPVKEIPSFIAAGLVISIPIIYLMYDNYLISESVSGELRPSAVITPLENINHLFSSFSVLFPATITGWLICMAAALLLLYFIVSRGLLNNNQADENISPTFPVLQTSLVLFVFYLVAIILLRLMKEFDTLGVRLISPAFPPFWILCCCALFHYNTIKSKRLVTRLLALIIMVSIVFQGGALYRDIRSSLSVYESPKYPYRRNFSHANFTMMKVRGEAKQTLSAHCSNVGVVFANGFQGALKIEFMTGMTSMRMPVKIDEKFLDDLNALSVKACFLFDSRSQFDSFSEAVSKQGGAYKVMEVGAYIIIQYPL